MSRTLVEIEWFDLNGWKARLAELRADPADEQRVGLIAEIEEHIAVLTRFSETLEKSSQDGDTALVAPRTP